MRQHMNLRLIPGNQFAVLPDIINGGLGHKNVLLSSTEKRRHKDGAYFLPVLVGVI
jgi:hypothetical protein